jgi:hypothetical protein
MPITAVEKATPMNHYTAPYGINSVMDRWRYRQEWQRWLAEQAFDRFVTLNFNRDTTPAGARRTLGRFLAACRTGVCSQAFRGDGDKASGEP